MSPQPSAVDGVRLDSRKHILELDGLRGLAILMVLGWHYIGLAGVRPAAGVFDRAVFHFLGICWSGVDLFFVLSGFLITGILLDSRGSSQYFRNFYGRRCLRIFPLYYFVLAIVFVITPLFSGFDTPKAEALSSHQLWYWTYTSNLVINPPVPTESNWFHLGHFWSLSIEEQFYLVWPFVVLLFAGRGLKGICGLIIFGSWILRFFFAKWGWTHATYTFTLCRLDPLALGALIAIIGRQPGGIARLRPWALTLVPIGAILLTLLFLPNDQLWPHDVRVHLLGLPAFCALYGGLLVMVLMAPPTSPLSRVMRMGWLRSFGKYSYGIYVYHMLLVGTYPQAVFAADGKFIGHRADLLERWLTRQTGMQMLSCYAAFFIQVAVVYAVAWLSWRLLERPFLALKRYFPSTSATAAAA